MESSGHSSHQTTCDSNTSFISVHANTLSSSSIHAPQRYVEEDECMDIDDDSTTPFVESLPVVAATNVSCRNPPQRITTNDRMRKTFDVNISLADGSKIPFRASNCLDDTSTRAGTFGEVSEFNCDVGISSVFGDGYSPNNSGNKNYGGRISSATVAPATAISDHATNRTNPTSQQAAVDKYAMQKYLLYFLDPEVEQRYFNFQYVDNTFLSGKIFGLMWSSVMLATLVLFTQPFSNNASYTIEAFTSLWWMGSYIGGGISGIMTIGLFIDRLKPYREAMHLVQVFVGWPVFSLAYIALKQPITLAYSPLQPGYVFCMLIAQARICRNLLLVTLWPTVCLAAVTLGVPDYWHHHTKIEMMYWVSGCIPILLLFFLERLARKAFVDREKDSLVIAEIEHKTLVTQRMIANFFPATPTRDLLTTISGGPRDKAYSGVVLVVTDIEMFTAYTTASTPKGVLKMLVSMYREIDEAADRFGVEKIATVGDSYCGALFDQSSSSPSTAATAERCRRGMMFSLAAIPTTGRSLHLRVGLHIGDVVGMFIGCAPPKFDLFGPGIDHARMMEEEGSPSAVHASHAFVEAAGVSPDALPTTALGVLCRSMGELLGLGVAQLQQEQFKEGSVVNDPKLIVEALCALAHIDPPEPSPEEDGHSHSEFTVDDDTFAFSKVFLRFKKPHIEERFQVKVKETGIVRVCAWVFLIQTCVLYFIQQNLMCGTNQDQAISSIQFAILAGMGVYIHYFGTDTPYHIVITYVAYNSLQILAFLGLRTDCVEGRLELQHRYVSDIACGYMVMSMFTCQYCISVRMTYRAVLALGTGAIMAISMIIRYYTIADGVAQFDFVPSFSVVFIIVTYVPEYFLRSAFQAELQLDQIRRAAKSCSAAMSASALSIMLPTFVTEKLVALAQEEHMVVDNPLAALATRSVTMRPRSGGADDIDFNRLAATWEYGHVVVMFASFTSTNASSLTPNTVNLTMQAIEEVVCRFRIKKVKTIGSTIMLVGGADDPTATRQELVAGMVEAAVAIRALILQPIAASTVPDLSYRFGVHCGPCFGAVMGGNGAVFDLVGDMVNMASRMMTTAENRTIQYSLAVHHPLLPRLKAAATQRSDVRMKGKGTMTVYKLDEGVRADVLRANDDGTPFTHTSPLLTDLLEQLHL